MEQTNSTGLWTWIIAIALIIVGPLLLIEAALDLPDTMPQVAGTIVVSLLVSWVICSLRVEWTNQRQALDQSNPSDRN